MSITTRLNKLQEVYEKFINNEELTKKDIEFVEKNTNKIIRELENELGWVYDLKDNLGKDYVLNLES